MIRLGVTLQQNPVALAPLRDFLFSSFSSASWLQRITFGDPVGGDHSTKSLWRCAPLRDFLFSSFSSASWLRRITFGDPVGGDPSTNPCGLRATQGFFVFLLQPASWLRTKTKNPWHFVQGILLRSVADSNRRKRFCRPLPSHSVTDCTPY